RRAVETGRGIDLQAIERDRRPALEVEALVGVAGEDTGGRGAVIPEVVVGVEARRGRVVAGRAAVDAVAQEVDVVAARRRERGVRGAHARVEQSDEPAAHT